MLPFVAPPAHATADFAELVCSNSFRSDDAQYNAVGLLHAEMRGRASLVLACADAHGPPAGGALAVDREGFAQAVTERISSHPLISVERGEVAGLPPPAWDNVIIATGPLTSAGLSLAIAALTGAEALAFFDAIAPIVHLETIDMSVAWRQSRYDKSGPAGDAAAYINCPMTREQYEGFVDSLLAGPKAEFKDWENVPYFDCCLPIEAIAEPGRETLRHGPMKPVGLANPHRGGERAYAVVQLRQDNALGTLWNMVGFQTKLKHGAQTEIFRAIPGLEKAVFARLGGLHRNTFLDSPRFLDERLRLKAEPRLRFAGQITGVEGYVASAAPGLVAGRLAAAERAGATLRLPPPTTALGALLGHITGGHLDGRAGSFQPMNINYGLLPPVDAPPRQLGGRRFARGEKARKRKRAVGLRALADLDAWVRDGSGGDAALATQPPG